MSAFKPGDRVNWLYTSSGGYGFTVPVAGVVVKVGNAKIQIKVAEKIDGKWVSQLKWVKPERLTPRDKDVPEVDD
ncbi:hypothetical protein MCAMS1_02830 [biofilm metagenome]